MVLREKAVNGLYPVKIAKSNESCIIKKRAMVLRVRPVKIAKSNSLGKQEEAMVLRVRPVKIAKSNSLGKQEEAMVFREKDVNCLDPVKIAESRC